MQAGELKTKIRIQKEITTGTGSFATKSWVDLGNILPTDEPKYTPSKWVNLHGSEAWVAWVANSVQERMGATVTIRYKANITHACRVLTGDTVYQIVSLDNIRQENHWLEIKVKAAVNG